MSDYTLHNTLALSFSMGMVVLLSPETFVLALLMAAHKTHARLNSVVFFLSSAIGLFFAMGIGMWITTPSLPGTEEPSWIRFAVRASIGTALLGLGIFRAWQFLTEKDSDTRKPKPFVQKWKGKIINLFPCLKTDSSTPINTYYLMSTFLIGLFTTGLHPKTSIVAIAVGHQIIRADGEFAKVSGSTLFTILALLPSIFPLVLSIYRPEAGPALKDKCTGLLEKHGRWIAALLCFAFGIVLWKDALTALPR